MRQKGAVPDAGGGLVLEGTAKNGAAPVWPKGQVLLPELSLWEEAATPAPFQGLLDYHDQETHTRTAGRIFQAEIRQHGVHSFGWALIPPDLLM